MCLHSLRLKKHYFPHTVRYCYSSMPHLSETCRFLQSSSFWKNAVCSDWPAIQCIIIGWIPQACDGNVTPLIILGNTQQYYSENKSYAFFLCGNIWVALQLQKTHANRKSTSKSRKHFHHFDSRWCKCSQHNQIQFICSAFLFWLCCEHLRCQIDESVFLICRCFFLFAARFFFGCVVSICSICVVKLMKVFP